MYHKLYNNNKQYTYTHIVIDYHLDILCLAPGWECNLFPH